MYVHTFNRAAFHAGKASNFERSFCSCSSSLARSCSAYWINKGEIISVYSFYDNTVKKKLTAKDLLMIVKVCYKKSKQ